MFAVVVFSGRCLGGRCPVTVSTIRLSERRTTIKHVTLANRSFVITRSLRRHDRLMFVTWPSLQCTGNTLAETANGRLVNGYDVGL